jgi:hypothetical protein
LAQKKPLVAYCHFEDSGNMLGTPAGQDGFTGGLSHI